MKIGLVLEGGGMRGMYTAGVLDCFLDNGIKVDGIMGVSAGALFGVNLASKQRGRALNYNTKYIKHPMYMSYKSLIKTGNMINKEFAYYVLPQKLDVFNQKEFENSHIDYYVTVTNVDTCQAEYIKINNVFEEMEYLRASSSLPFISEIVTIDGKNYLDGGIADSIPFEKFIELGYDKIILVLTRPISYRKQYRNSRLLRKFIAMKYGKLANTIIDRPINYNQKIENIIKLEAEGKLFVIRPSEDIKISRLEKNVEKIKATYELGLNDTQKVIKNLKEYLIKSVEIKK